MMIEIIRGLVRPTVTWGFSGSWIAFEAIGVARGGKPSTEFLAVCGLIIAFYFVERHLLKRNQNS